MVVLVVFCELGWPWNRNLFHDTYIENHGYIAKITDLFDEELAVRVIGQLLMYLMVFI